jgi:hypothetical protein
LSSEDEKIVQILADLVSNLIPEECHGNANQEARTDDDQASYAREVINQ